ncbi:MAG: TlpA family protein disulfide reductase [Deltaproteobacteria bacterium]|nr:TlpA family protein disulfide reductase [Deltaproteobacteria bacterium]
MKYLFFGLLSLFLFATDSYGVDRAHLKAAGIQEMSQSAPGFTLKGPGGRPVTLRELRGKVVLLHFWATWCKPCKDEFPLLEKVYEGFKGRGLALLPIAIDPDIASDKISSFAKGLGGNFPVYPASEGDVPEKYRAWGVPSTYFIDKEGNIVGKAIGPRDWSSAEVKSLVEALLLE